MSQGFKRVGRVLQVAITAVLALLLAGNLYLLASQHLLGVAYPSLFGYSTAVVVSGSMEPALSVDDLIVLHRQTDYAPGDIITYRNGDNLVTHRIVEKTPKGFVTQGDANNAPDAQPVCLGDVQGKVVANIPFVGLVSTYLKTPVGLTVLVFVGLLILEFPFLLHLQQKGADDGEGPEHGNEPNT